MDLRTAEGMARELLAEHGLHGWSFRFDRARVRAGACHYGTRTITLSPWITAAHDPSQVRETLLHEIAHALVGPRHAHDAVWRARARSIGARTTPAPSGAGEPASTVAEGAARR